MQAFLHIISENTAYIILAMSVLIIALIAVCTITLLQLTELKKKYKFFMGDNAKPSARLESKINEYITDVKGLKDKYSKVLKLTEDIDKNLEQCVQKVGIVRYNPFDEVGGNLCFSVALLDSKNDGLVITGIHSRTGSFTYAKPVEMSVSPYVLSEEEMEAITKAKNVEYKGIDREAALQKINEMKFHVKVRPKRNKYIRENMMGEQVALDEIIKEETKMESQMELSELNTDTQDNNNFEENEIQEQDLLTPDDEKAVENP